MEFKVNSIQETKALEKNGEVTIVRSTYLYNDNGTNFCIIQNSPKPEDDKFELGVIYTLIKKT